MIDVKINIRIIVLWFLLTLVLATGLSHMWSEEQFYYLAKSFLAGRVDFVTIPGSLGDVVPFGGKYYWPTGLFPGVLMVPGVWLFEKLNLVFRQGYLQMLLVVFETFIVWRLARKLHIKNEIAQWLTIAWLGGSVFVGVALQPWSWYFAQVVTTLLIFLAIYEYETKRRYGIIGLIYGLILNTRVSASVSLIFFVYAVIANKTNRIKNLIALLFPILCACVVMGFYNNLRFKDWFEQGYSWQLVPDHAVMRRSEGVFSIKHIPGNLYYMLIAPPVPVFKDDVSHLFRWPFITYSSWGMGLVFTSPYLLKMFWLKYKGTNNAVLWITVASVMVVVVLYYGIGWRQYGYRYALDFLPLLHYLLLKNWEKGSEMSWRLRLVILLSVITNVWFISVGDV